ncbi:uncharacterized protein LOC109841922 [Asparagus officinalis]|uniref:uncharacterized protein LOC109841922 n=1 Tax=Asparagus officinalis TaxID=4686 RepID=UPI00098E353D|nr:uncharacterized protein LOC109841922 [Asparagus officinalis]
MRNLVRPIVVIFLKDVLAMENDELLKAIAKAPKNAKYTTNDIKKQILHVFSVRLKNAIREEVGVAKYCIIVDEARDESKKEQMSIVLRFVDTNGFIQERFFRLVHVSDTAALTLKNAIYSALAHYNLDVQNIRGQGYDRASNMRGEFNGLQALIMKDFNMVGASCKRNDELKKAHADDIAHLISINELETMPGLNQISTLQQAADTPCTVLLKVMEDGLPSQRADATSVYDEMTSFDFVFIIHLMSEIMGITDFLCQTLQRKSQDISNAMELVSSTKRLLQELRDDNAQYVDRRRRVRGHQDITIGHHYRVDFFYAAIDSQMQKINMRFSKDATELLMLSSALNPQNASEALRIQDICKLVGKFYAQDFTSEEKESLKMQLKHYEHNVVKGSDFKTLSTISELCQWLVKTNKFATYDLIFRVIVLVLTLPVSTATAERSFSAMNIVKTRLATAERSFSAMNIVKTRLRSKMEDVFLSDALMVFIEREIAKSLSIDAIIEYFKNFKERRIPFS